MLSNHKVVFIHTEELKVSATPKEHNLYIKKQSMGDFEKKVEDYIDLHKNLGWLKN